MSNGTSVRSQALAARAAQRSIGVVSGEQKRAVLEAVAPLVPPPQLPQLKWPNDLLIGGAKLCGVLLERVSDAVVIGIGVNLASAPQVDGRETAALSAFGPAPDRDTFAAVLARQFDLRLSAIGVPPAVADALQQDFAWLGDLRQGKQPFAAVTHCLCGAP